MNKKIVYAAQIFIFDDVLDIGKSISKHNSGTFTLLYCIVSLSFIVYLKYYIVRKFSNTLDNKNMSELSKLKFI